MSNSAQPPLPDILASEVHASLQQAGMGVALFDPAERLRYANAWFLDAFDLEPAAEHTWESMLRDCHRKRRGLLVQTDDIDGWIATVRSKHRQTPHRQFESDMVDGRWLWVSESTRPDGWVFVACTDITALKANEASLRKAHDAAVIASLTDPLTGLYNRRHVLQRLHDLLGASRAMRYPLCVALLDIDHFKQINDSHGHGAGDAVLRHLAEQLKRQLRPLDAVGRIGGEEFLFIMPNASLDGADAVMRRLRRSLAEQPPQLDSLVLGCNFSAGLACAQPHDTVDGLVQRADRGLYLAKEQGRGRQMTADT